MIKLTNLLNEEDARLNKKVNKFLKSKITGVYKSDAKMHLWIIKEVLKHALTEGNFHSEVRKLEKSSIFKRADKVETEFFDGGADAEEFSNSLLSAYGDNVAKWAKWDGVDIINAISFYANMNYGGGFGDKIKSEFLNESVKLNEADIRKTLEQDISKEIKVPSRSISVGVGGFAPKKTKDGNLLVVVGLDERVKKISIPQADYFGKEISYGGYLVVKADPKTGKLIKVIGRFEDTNDITLGKYINEESDPCWDDYEMVGTKTKNGKEVPNCVPKNEVEEYADALEKTKEVEPESLEEGIVTIALGVAGAVLLLKILKKVFKLVAGAIGIMVPLPKDKLKEIVSEMTMEFIKKDPRNSIEAAKLQRALHSAIEDGDIKTMKDIIGVVARLKKKGVVKLRESKILDEEISRSFTKAAESYQKEQLKLQDIVDEQEEVVKKFKKAKGDEKEKLKKELIRLHKEQKTQMKKVHDTEKKFEKALNNEPVELEESNGNLKKGDRVKIQQGHDKTANGRVKLSGKSGTITNVMSSSYVVDVDGVRKYTIRKDDVVKESTKLTDIMNEINSTKSGGCGCGCGCNGKKKLSESVDVIDDRYNIGKVTDSQGDDWYVKKIDSTHMFMANDPKYLKKDKPTGVMAHHIAQHRDTAYYNDLKKWLKETNEINERGTMRDDVKKVIDKVKGFSTVQDDGVLKFKNSQFADKASDKLNDSGIAASSKGKYVYLESLNEGDIKVKSSNLKKAMNLLHKKGMTVHMKDDSTITMLDKYINRAKNILKSKGMLESMNEAVRPSDTIEKLQKIVDSSSRSRVDGTMVDLTTANIVLQVYNQANDRMKKKLNDLGVKQLINIAFKVIK